MKRFVPLLLALALPAFAQQEGGTAVIGLIQEPGQLNRMFNNQSGSDLSYLTVEPLFTPDASGEYLPVLAAELPTVENGGVSEDSLTVTYRLKEGLTWSDGEPFTAEDLVFTWEVLQNPESAAVGSAVVPAYESVASVTALDPQTVEVKFNQVEPGYLELWQAVLPAHLFDSSAVTSEHPQARIPLGTGPFVIDEWRTGDRITLRRNPNYREAGKPYLDGITVQVIPDRQVALSSLTNGEVDTLFFVTTGDLPVLTGAQESGQGVVVELQETPSWVEWLWLNHSNYGDQSIPHPVLGDPAIREAMDYGIDRQAVIDGVLEGFSSLTGSFIYAGWAAVEKPATPYDPEQARQVLEEAGWQMGADGVRSKDGVRATLRFQTVAGDAVRELYQQVIQQNLRDVGIELLIENVPSNLLFGSYAEGGLIPTGDFDITMSRDGYYVDPAAWAELFTCGAIPSQEKPDGFSYTHWCNEAFDTVVARGGSTADQSVREAAYAEAVELFAQERVALPLYSSAWGWAWQDSLGGVSTDYWNGMWMGSADWFLEE